MKNIIALDQAALAELTDQIIRSTVEQICQVNQSQGGLKHMARAWPYQKIRDVRKHGKDKAPWYVGFRDLEGRKQGKWCGPGKAGYQLALKERQRIEAELVTGTYKMGLSVGWEQFRQEYESRILAGKSRATQVQYMAALDRFERLIRPKKVSKLTTGIIDQFISRRAAEPNRYHPERPVTCRSVNCDLLCIKAVLGIAHDWGYLAERPKFRFLKVPKRLPRYTPPDDFVKVYKAADLARLPRLPHCSAGDWWRALLVFVYVATGWRISQVLGLLWHDTDVSGGSVTGRACVDGNKARTDRLVKLHPLALNHLTRIRGFAEKVFEWPHHPRTLHSEFHRIQEIIGIKCHYGFHDLRRGFATMNAANLDPKMLQHLMQHAKLETTQEFYVNPLAAQDEAVARLYVPPGLTG